MALKRINKVRALERTRSRCGNCAFSGLENSLPKRRSGKSGVRAARCVCGIACECARQPLPATTDDDDIVPPSRARQLGNSGLRGAEPVPCSPRAPFRIRNSLVRSLHFRQHYYYWTEATYFGSFPTTAAAAASGSFSPDHVQPGSRPHCDYSSPHRLLLPPPPRQGKKDFYCCVCFSHSSLAVAAAAFFDCNLLIN